MNDVRDRIDMSYKVKEIIDEALKGFFKIKSRKIRGTIYNIGETEGLDKAKRFLEGWGIDGKNLREYKIASPGGAALLELVRSEMKGKICVDAPEWFGRCEHDVAPPTILYVPEKLALKMLALGCLPEPEKEEVSA